MPKLIHTSPEPVIVFSNEPLPKDPAMLAEQIRRFAEMRRLAAAHHDQWCRCTPCRVRIYDERRDWAQQAAS